MSPNAHDRADDREDEHHWSGFTGRQRTALMLAGLALFYALTPVALVMAEDFVAGYNQASTGGHIAAVNGPDVTLGQTYQLRSGNPTTDHSVNVSTASHGYINLSSPSSGAAVTVEEINGSWTRLSGLNVASAPLTADVSDKQRVELGGDLETFNYTQMEVGDSQVDFEYTGTGDTASVTIYGLPGDLIIRAVDPGGDTLDAARASPAGVVTLDNLPLSSHQVQLVGSVGDYYANESSNVNSDAWFAGVENATMDDIISMSLRLGPYIIGTGEPVGGGAGYAGVLLLGLLVAGIFVGAVAGTPLGGSGASVVALIAGYGLVEVGLAPEWMKIVLLFLLGGVASVVFIRAMR